MDEQKEQALIRRRAERALSDQSLDFLSDMSICSKCISLFLHKFKTIYEYKYMEKADIGNEREEFMQETQHTQQTATRTAQNQDKKTT